MLTLVFVNYAYQLQRARLSMRNSIFQAIPLNVAAYGCVLNRRINRRIIRKYVLQ